MARRKKVRNPILPDDLICEILLRIPVKSVDRFKCVSKSWHSLLSSSLFFKEQLDHFVSIDVYDEYPRLLTLSTTIGNQTKDGASRKAEIPRIHGQHSFVAGSCRGLVLIMHKTGDFRGSIVNPVTLETIQVSRTGLPSQLEHTSLDNCMHGLGYDSSSDDYKTVLISRFGGRTNLFFNVVYIYSLRTKTWRRIGNLPDKDHPTGRGLFVNGCLHWISKTGTQNKTYDISAFNLATEEFETVPYPKCLKRVDGYDHLTLLGGCLALVINCCYFFDSTDVWLMKEYGVQNSWTKFMRIHVPRHDHVRPIFRLLCFLNESEVVLLKNNKKFVAYDWRKRDWREMALDGPSDLKYGRDITGFKKSLISLDYN